MFFVCSFYSFFFFEGGMGFLVIYVMILQRWIYEDYWWEAKDIVPTEQYQDPSGLKVLEVLINIILSFKSWRRFSNNTFMKESTCCLTKWDKQKASNISKHEVYPKKVVKNKQNLSKQNIFFRSSGSVLLEWTLDFEDSAARAEPLGHWKSPGFGRSRNYFFFVEAKCFWIWIFGNLWWGFGN